MSVKNAHENDIEIYQKAGGRQAVLMWIYSEKESKLQSKAISFVACRLFYFSLLF